jgi:AcrR family transcriptional regulator
MADSLVIERCSLRTLYETNTVRCQGFSGYDVRVTATSGGTSRRDRPAKPPLSRAVIVEAALAILQRDGMAGVTMRAVATALDTGPASLYAYFGNRDDLLHEMLNAVMAEVPVPQVDPLRWREQLKELGIASVEAMQAHRGIARVAVGYIPTGHHTLVVGEAMLQMLKAGGVGPQSSAWALDLLALYITAIAYELAVEAEEGVPEPQRTVEVVTEIRDAFSQMSPAEFPLLSVLSPLLTLGTRKERFEFGLDVLINGLLATPEPQSASDVFDVASTAQDD